METDLDTDELEIAAVFVWPKWVGRYKEEPHWVAITSENFRAVLDLVRRRKGKDTLLVRVASVELVLSDEED